MAATRNKNTYCDYLLEQNNNISINNYILYKNGSNGRAYETNLPSLGSNKLITLVIFACVRFSCFFILNFYT